MNEKFLELAKQCGYWSGQTIEMNDVGIEKFAELLIRECIVDFYRNYLDTTSDEDITEQVDRYVKEHFGVE